MRGVAYDCYASAWPVRSRLVQPDQHVTKALSLPWHPPVPPHAPLLPELAGNARNFAHGDPESGAAQGSGLHEQPYSAASAHTSLSQRLPMLGKGDHNHSSTRLLSGLLNDTASLSRES